MYIRYTGNRGVKSNGFNFCLDSPTSLLRIRPLRAFPPTHPVEAGRRVLQIVRPIAKGSTKGVTVKIETGREGGVERGEERNGRALRGRG